MPRDKEKKKAYDKEYYQKNVKRLKDYQRDRYKNNKNYAIIKSKERRLRLREFINQQRLGISCERCGIDDPRVLDFHHIDPSKKEGTLSSFVAKNWGEKHILNEIEKCNVLCANCHRILHWEERQLP